MGRLKNMVLGDVTGKVGNVVFRVKGKKSFLYTKPKQVKVSQAKGAKDARSKFTPLSRFSSFINSVPDLKYFWGKSDIKASSSYHKISKLNYKFFLHNRPSINNEITPGYCGYCGSSPVRTSFLDKSGLRLEAKYEKNQLAPLEEEEYISAIAIICFYNPIKRWGKYFVLDQLVMDFVDVKFEEPFEFIIPFTEGTLKNYYSYRNSILYLSLITRDINGNPLRYHTNYKNEFIHEYPEEERKSISKMRGEGIGERIKQEYKGYMKRIFSMWGKE